MQAINYSLIRQLAYFINVLSGFKESWDSFQWGLGGLAGSLVWPTRLWGMLEIY